MRRAAFAALLLAACHPQSKTLTYEGAEAKTPADRIALGRRLADILDCTGCHGANLQGHDMADKPQDGAMYSPNVTLAVPRYSDAELDRLIRHGMPKDGREFWFMPVESFQFVSDADFAALTAYLRTLRPQGQPLPPFKFNAGEYKDVQQGILGNAQTQIRKYRENPTVDLGSQYLWGRYLVQTTCTMCHNNALQGWPNFTPNLDIAATYSKAELTRLLTTGQGRDGKDVGPMSGVARHQFSHFTTSEREAVVDYILARAKRSR